MNIHLVHLIYPILQIITHSNATDLLQSKGIIDEETKVGLESFFKGLKKVSFLDETIEPAKDWISNHWPCIKYFTIPGLSLIESEISDIISIGHTMWNGGNYSDSKFFSFPNQGSKFSKLVCTTTCKIFIQSYLLSVTASPFVASTGTKMICNPTCARIKEFVKYQLKILSKDAEQSNFLNGLNGTHIQNSMKATTLLTTGQSLYNQKEDGVSVYDFVSTVGHEIGKFIHDFARDSCTIGLRETLLHDKLFGKESSIPHYFYVIFTSYLDMQNFNTASKAQEKEYLKAKEPQVISISLKECCSNTDSITTENSKALLPLENQESKLFKAEKDVPPSEGELDLDLYYEYENSIEENTRICFAKPDTSVCPNTETIFLIIGNLLIAGLSHFE